jgi:hypothetical protein
MARVGLGLVLSVLRSASGIGWEYADTGGGCTALQSEVVNGRYHLITDGGCVSVNEVEGSSYLRGISIDTNCTWTLGTYLNEDDGQLSITDYDGWQDLIDGVSNLKESREVNG